MKKNEISATDIIFATVISIGRVVCTLTIAGVNSLAEVMKEIGRRTAGQVNGLVTLVLRNGTRGWSTRQALRLVRSVRPEGIQLSLF